MSDINNQQSAPVDTGAAAASPSIDPAQMREALREVMTEFNQPEETTQQQPLSEEERDRLLGVWKPDNNYIGKLRRAITADDATEQERLEALVELRSGLMGQSQRYSDLRAQQLEQKLMQIVAPLLGHVQQNVQQKTEQEFYGEYSELKDYPEVVQAAALKLKRAGVTYKTPAEGRKLLAEETAKILGKVNPGFKLSDRQQTQQPGQIAGGMPQMASVSTGATAGSTKQKSSGGSGIWDD
jgi:hypothetical protein